MIFLWEDCFSVCVGIKGGVGWFLGTRCMTLQKFSRKAPEKEKERAKKMSSENDHLSRKFRITNVWAGYAQAFS